VMPAVLAEKAVHPHVRTVFYFVIHARAIPVCARNLSVIVRCVVLSLLPDGMAEMMEETMAAPAIPIHRIHRLKHLQLHLHRRNHLLLPLHPVDHPPPRHSIQLCFHRQVHLNRRMHRPRRNLAAPQFRNPAVHPRHRA
jgi:hypothetical protein